jgi:hypothetical protein
VNFLVRTGDGGGDRRGLDVHMGVAEDIRPGLDARTGDGGRRQPAKGIGLDLRTGMAKARYGLRFSESRYSLFSLTSRRCIPPTLLY